MSDITSKTETKLKITTTDGARFIVKIKDIALVEFTSAEHIKVSQFEIKKASDEILFEEWRELFTRYKNEQVLQPLQRRRFRALSAELRRRRFFKNEPGLHS